ncbi:hypothetical protein TSAR_000432 [Trichomalopsis sarcophagae]|uniref:Uncharacterized protein n=1 Tax=Trichomalopsis sarcophagae TaxID=543379 RepID=A0A232FHB4_9HYME|nr:hypothetical protein TSAR_000432 [Trichomalopsis sarcophagae]
MLVLHAVALDWRSPPFSAAVYSPDFRAAAARVSSSLLLLACSLAPPMYGKERLRAAAVQSAVSPLDESPHRTLRLRRALTVADAAERAVALNRGFQ